MPEQVRQVLWRVVGAIVVYNLVLGLAIYWIGGRTKDRFTGAQGMAMCIGLNEVREELGLIALECPIRP